MTKHVLMGLLVLALCGALTAQAATIRVPEDAGTITAALAAAQAGDVIELASGTYTETAMLDIQTSNVTVRSTAGATVRTASTEPAVVRIGSSIQGVSLENLVIERPTADNDWMRGVQMDQASSATLRGVTLQGPANGVGILLLNGADVVAEGCTFRNFNPSATWAGAITLEGNSGDFSSVVVRDSVFDSGCNRWITTVGGAAPRVGALTLQRNEFRAPLASQPLYFQYDTAYHNQRDLLLEDCTLEGSILEVAEFHYTTQGAPRSLQFVRCEFKKYDSLRKVLWIDIPAPVTFESTVFAGGKHETLMTIWGGPSQVTLHNSTFANDGVTGAESESGNSGSTFINGWDGGRTFNVRNCLFYSPTSYTPAFDGDAGSSANRTYDIDYSIINHAQPTGAHVTLTTGANYGTTALSFVNTATGDYRPASGSAAIDAGTFVSSRYQLDAAGNPRKLGPRYDMGAYEFVQAARVLNVPAPYATLAAAIADAGGSDTITIAAGVYTEADISRFNMGFIRVRGTGNVTLRAPSSADSVIALSPWVRGMVFENLTLDRPSADTDWRRCVEQHGNSAAEYINCRFSGPANGVGVILFNGSDGTFRNCTFSNFNPGATWAGAISLEYNDNGEYSDVVVDGCTFDTGCNRWIASVGGNLPFIGNVIVKNTEFKASNVSHALWFPGGLRYHPEGEVLFEDCTLNGTILEIGEFHYSPTSPRAFTMRRVKVNAYDSMRRVFFLDLASPMLFENLLIAGGKHETAIRIWGGPPAVTFEHCTLVTDGVTSSESESGLNGAALVDGWDGGRTFVVRNSLFHSPANGSGALGADASAAATRIYDIDNSIIDHPTPQGTNALIFGGADYSNAPILFENAAGRDYHLASGSPAIDLGINLGIALDLDKGPRLRGAAPDAGAFESSYGGSPSAVCDWLYY